VFESNLNEISLKIFLGGSGQSGTTILRELLGKHPEIYSIPQETRFIIECDGLKDLATHLCYSYHPNKADIAIYRFSKKMLVDKISSKTYPNRGDIRNFYGKKFYTTIMSDFIKSLYYDIAYSRNYYTISSIRSEYHPIHSIIAYFISLFLKVSHIKIRILKILFLRYFPEYKEYLEKDFTVLIKRLRLKKKYKFFLFHTLYKSILFYKRPYKYRINDCYHDIKRLFSYIRTLCNYNKNKIIIPKKFHEEEYLSLCRNLVESLFLKKLHEEKKKIWCEKTPNNILELKFLYKLFPNAKFIHIKRDPRELVYSLIRTYWGPNDIISATYWTKNTIERIIEVLNEVKPSENEYLEIKLEDLINNPKEIFKKIKNFLGLKQDFINYSKLDKNRVGYWKKRLQPNQIEIIDNILGDLINKFGY